VSQARPALARVQHIVAALNTRKRTRIAQLADELEVSTRTISRDLDHLKDSLRLPIESDIAGFYFTQPVQICRSCGRRVRRKKP
jgi:predicted DNA-binding transcriptional regulator YafY